MKKFKFLVAGLALMASCSAFAQGPVAVVCGNCMDYVQGNALINGINQTTTAVNNQSGKIQGLLDEAKKQTEVANQKLQLAKDNSAKFAGDTGSTENAAALSALYQAYQTTQGIYQHVRTEDQEFLASQPQYGEELRKQARASGQTEQSDASFYSATADRNAKALFQTVSAALQTVQVTHSLDAMQNEQKFIQNVLAASNGAQGQKQVMQMTNQLIASLAVSAQRARELSTQQANSQIAWIQYSIARDEATRIQTEKKNKGVEQELDATSGRIYKYLTGSDLARKTPPAAASGK